MSGLGLTAWWGTPGGMRSTSPERRETDVSVNEHSHIPFQKEIEFIVSVGVAFDTGKVGVVIIIDFEIFGYHVLPGTEGSLKIFFLISTSVNC